MSEQAKAGDQVEVFGDAELGLMLGACRVVSVSGEHLVVAAPRFSTWSELNGFPVQLSRKAETGVFIGSAQVETETATLGQLLRLRVAGNWRKVQRRENVRLPADLHIRQAVLLRAGEPLPLAVTIVNISASGCLMRVSPLPPLHSRVRLTIELPDAEPPIEVEAVAVRIEPDDRPSPKSGRLAVHFDSPPSRTQDRIVRFIFREQIRRLQPK